MFLTESINSEGAFSCIMGKNLKLLLVAFGFLLILSTFIFTQRDYLGNQPWKQRLFGDFYRQTAKNFNLWSTSDPREKEASSVLCLITTQVGALNSKVKAINATWARRCDKVLYVISKAGAGNITGQDILKLDVPDGRGHLTAKSMQAFTHVYDNYLRNYSWFLKGDDDTYVIVENLKRLLSINDFKSSVTLGHYFKMHNKGGYGYHSGGASYVMSQKALQDMIEKGVRLKGQCKEDGGDEDVEVQACLLKTGSRPHKSIDRLGRETFHPESYKDYLVGPMWPGAKVYSRHEPKVGPECCSELLITFHRMSPELIYLFDQLLYRTTVYGREIEREKIARLLTNESEPKL